MFVFHAMSTTSSCDSTEYAHAGGGDRSERAQAMKAARRIAEQRSSIISVVQGMQKNYKMKNPIDLTNIST